MTVNATSSNAYAQHIGSAAKNQPVSAATLRQAFRGLGHALQAGDLPGAKQAFTTIQSAWAASKPATQNWSGSTAVQSGLSGLGQALQSGNVLDAQRALDSLKNLLTTIGGHRQGSGSANGINSVIPGSIATQNKIDVLI
jgi:predicted lipid-binding transport protein (Tim44 family)